MTEPPTTAELDLAAFLPRLQMFFRARGWRHESEDLAGEVVIRVLAAIRRNEAIEHVGAYCLGTARLVMLERMRRPPDPAPFPEGWEPPAPEPEPEDARVPLLRHCLSELGPRDRELVLAYYGEGQGKGNRAQLAERLGVSLNAVHIKACRLRGQVRRCVEARAGLSGATHGGTN